ncbi:MAG: FUSC family protein [Bryobacteraceae bacterium]
MRNSMLSGLNRQTLEHAARTTVAATVSLAVARVFRLPDAQWAVISTMVVTQSTLGASLTISGQRFAGTALGATVAAVLATRFGSSILVFAVGVLGLGLVCATLRLDRAAHRFAGITLATVVLVSRSEPAWIIGAHRFVEVSIGIATGLVMTALWPERERQPSTRAHGSAT